MSTILDIDFNSGASLTSLGFFDINDCANVAAVGPDGSSAMSWQSSNDLADCKLAISQGTSTEICLSGVWVPKVYTDWRVVALDYFNGVSYIVDLQLYTDSGTRQIFLEQRNGDEVWRSASNFFTIDVPLYWRLSVKASTRSGGSWLNDGIVKLWTGTGAASLSLQVTTTTALIEDSYSQPYAWSHLTFGPQGILDDLFAENVLCDEEEEEDDESTNPDPVNSPVDDAKECCISHPPPGSVDPDVETEPDPTIPYSQYFECEGDGDVDVGTDPLAPTDNWAV